MIFRFGDFEIDTARRELHRGDQLLRVEPQVFRLLSHLIRRRHRIVSRDELISSVWDGRIVSDAVIVSRIKSARAALGDDGRTQKWIRTLHRQGYRFVGEVQAEAAQLPVIVPAAAASSDVERIVASAETLDDLDLALPSQTSVAILPLQFEAVDPAGQLFADALTQDLITLVARSRWLFVAASGSTFRFRAGPYDPFEVGRALGVHYVVQGRLQRTGDRIRVHVGLADARSGAEIWGESLERRLDGIFEVQQEVAELLAGSLAARIEHLEQRRALFKPPASLDSWEAYHRGCWHMYRFTREDHAQAVRLFERSIELDPGSPRPWAGLSFVHWQRAFLELVPDPATEAARSLEFAQRGLDLDSYDPLGHWAVGRAHLLYGRVPEAVEALQVSVQLNPSSAVGQYSLAYALMQQGDPELSIKIVERARRLSPFDPMTFAMFGVRGQNLSFLGRHDESARFAERAATQPNSHYHVMAVGAYCNVLAGRSDVAGSLYQKVKQARPTYSFQDFIRAFRLQRQDHVELTKGAFVELEALHRRSP